MSRIEQESLSESSSMDRVTQTADCTDELIRIMYSSIAYLTRKGGFKTVNPNFPITQPTDTFPDSTEFQANIHELISDFTLKSKQLEYLISALPTRAPLSESDGTSPSTEERLDDEDGDTPLSELVKEYNAVNEEYKSCIEEAEKVSEQIKDVLAQMLQVHRCRQSTFAQNHDVSS